MNEVDIFGNRRRSFENFYENPFAKQVSKGRTLSGKELAKRKIRAKMAKASRKINRK